jgi:hypothetical protein
LKLPLILPSAFAVLALSMASPALAEPTRPRVMRPAAQRLVKIAPPMQMRAATRAPTVSSTVSLEVKDSMPARASLTSRFALPLGDRGGARIVSSASDHEYRISVRRDDDTPDSPVSFDIERSQRGPTPQLSEAKLRAVVRMRPGQKVVVARIERSDGSKTEVIASLK